MIVFLVQTIKGKIVHDFAFELERSIEYQIWRGNSDFKIEYSEIENIKDNCKDIQDKIVPVGSIEFVKAFCNEYFNKNCEKYLKPLNIPKELFKFANRKIDDFVLNENMDTIINDIIDISNNGQIFIKSNEVLKFENNGIIHLKNILNEKKFPNGKYQISEIKQIDSEYRCFIYNGQLIGIQYYNGDFKLFPDVKVIEDITKYFNDNTAYTIDIGVNYKRETFLIECHEFYSCGLYGFSDYNKLPYMFNRTFNKIVNRINNE